jgi:hypothetical protein
VNTTIPADVRAAIVRRLGRSLADAWRRQHAGDTGTANKHESVNANAPPARARRFVLEMANGDDEEKHTAKRTT